MAERLEEEFSLRRKLYRYKVLEMALMLLFLITLVNYLPFGGNKFEELKAFHFELFNSNNKTKNVFEAKKLENQKTQKEENKSEKKEQKIPVDVEKMEEENTDNQTVVPQPIAANNWKNTVSTTRLQQNTPPIIPTKSSKITSEISNTIYIGAKKSGVSENNPVVKNQTEGDLQSMLNSLELPKTELLNFNSILPSMILVPNKEKGFWRFGMAGSYDVNYIFSPDNEELGSSQDTTLGLGYGGGLLASYKKGRWGFETGAMYNHKSYPPNFINQFNPDNNPNLLESEFFQDIQLDILQIPINAQYFMVDKPKWRVYISSGMTINMLLQPVYKIQETRAALVATPAPAPPGGQPDKSLKNKTEFPIGILEGGEFRDNSFLTANLGLGVERSLGLRWNIFAQPSYQHQISKQGLRPFKDKFYTLSMTIGTRVTIK